MNESSGGPDLDRRQVQRTGYVQLLRDPVEAVVLVLSVLGLVLVLGLYLFSPGASEDDPAAGVGSSGSSDSATTEPDEPSASPTDENEPSASPTDEAPDGPSEIGESRVGDNLETTLLQVRKIVAGPDRSSAPGTRWFGIRARTCVGAGSQSSGPVGWSSWAVRDSSGAVHTGEEPPWPDFPAEQLRATSITAGECVSGWALVAVPTRAVNQIDAVVFRLGSPQSAEWSV